MSIWRDWLPADLPDKVQTLEPKRFRTTVRAFAAEWEANKTLSEAARSLETLKWISLFKSCMSTWHKPEIDAQDANLAVEALLDVMLTSKYCTASRIRWGDVLRKLLRNLRKTLTLTISWRPLYQAMCRCADAPAQAYTGLAMHYGEIRTWAQIVHRSRRFFAPGTAQEIWAEFSPALGNIFTPQCLEAVGWVVLFMPHQQLGRAPVQGDWNAWVDRIMRLWEVISPCEWFNNQALGWLARLAKHDRHGTIDWQRHLPFLYTRMLWSFHVPVGTATAQLPFTRGSMVFTETMFSLDAYYPADSVGKLAVYLLDRGLPGSASLAHGSPMEVDGAEDAAGDAALAQLERLGDLLEQYFHPSNNGSWDKSLASLLNTLTKHLSRRLAFERSPKDAHDTAHADAAQASQRKPLDDACLRRLVALFVRLSGRAQYSKSHSLQSAACSALFYSSYVAPDLALPLVYQRFQEALEAVAAVHQLVSAVHTFGHCLRPLLLSGMAALPYTAGPGGLEMQVPVGEAIAGALMATLPGIDANDPSKCLTIFRFYCLALSSLPVLPENPGEEGMLPLDTGIWLDDLLSRIFTMLENLEAPETRADTSNAAGTLSFGAGGASNLPPASFLADKQSVFRPMLSLLFTRLPPSLREQAFKRLHRFVIGTCLPSIARDAACMYEAAVRAAPEQAVKGLMLPLLERLQPDMQSNAEPSKAEEDSQKWRLTMVEAMSNQIGSSIVAARKPLADVIRLALYSSSKGVQECGQSLLIALTNNLAYYYPLAGYAASSRQHPFSQSAAEGSTEASGHGLRVEAWGEFRYRDGAPAFEEPSFHIPNANEVAFLEELVSEHLENAARALSAESGGIKSATAGDKQHLRGLLLAIGACLTGLGACLPAVDPAVPSDSGPRLSVIGHAGVPIGSADLRQEVQKAVLAATNSVADPELLALLASTVNLCVAAGNLDYVEHTTTLGDFRDDAAICNEPMIAGLTHTEEGLRWAKRWPRWLVVDRVWVQALWRSSQAAFRPWLSTKFVDPPASSIPASTWEAAAGLASLSMHSYPGVRMAASSALHMVLKRAPSLAPAIMPVFLSAVAGKQLPQWDQAEAPDALLERSLSELLPLMGQMRRADAFQQLSPAEAAKEEGEVAGAAGVLSGMPVFRLCSRHPVALAAFAATLMASGARTGPKTAGSITQLFSTVAVRLIRPPALTQAQVEHVQLPAAMGMLRSRLKEVTSSGVLHWRYGIIAEALQMFLLPPESEQLAAEATTHALDLLVASVPGHRALGAAQLLSLLQPSAKWRTAELQAAIKAAIQDKLGAVPDYGKQLMVQLTHAHPSQIQDGTTSTASMMQKLMAKPKEELVVDTLTQAQAHLHDWPANRPRPHALANDTFKLQHARIIKALAEVAPTEVHATLRSPLEEAVMSGQQDDDRPRTYAAAEVLSGLLAAGQWSPAEGEAWQIWLRPALTSALDAAPMDMHDVWATGMRFVLNGLAVLDNSLIDTFLPAITQLPSADAPSSAVVRRLKVLAGCLAELSNLGACGAIVHRSADASAAAEGQQRDLLPPASAQAVAVAQSLQASFLQEVLQLSVQTGKAIREGAAGCTVLAASPMLWEAQAKSWQAAGSEPSASDENLAAEILEQVAAGMQEGLSTVTAASEASEPSTPNAVQGNGHISAAEPGNLIGEPSIAKLGFALQLVLQTTRGGENVSVGPLVPTLAALLPSLLRVQELTAPEVQPLALEAKTAAAVVKYVPWPDRLLPQLTDLLSSAPSMEPWMARGAALAFAQYFWFRHAFLLKPEMADKIQGAALALLHDRKLEVQNMAAALLAGLLKGLSPQATAELRQQCIQRVETLFPVRRRKKAAASGSYSVAEKHAAVLALKAFVLSSPYDMPDWLASVLVALLRAAGQPSPIDSTVRKTLAEFKRTHEEAGLAQAQRLLGEDQWEAMRDVASPASYFA